MVPVRQLFLSITILIVSQAALADYSRGVSYSPSVDPDRYEQRQAYLDAIHLIRTSQFSKLKKVKPALRTYALYPYIEYTEMA